MYESCPVKQKKNAFVCAKLKLNMKKINIYFRNPNKFNKI